MRTLFADTFYFIALLNPSDPYHARVATSAPRRRERILTHGFVLTEVGDALLRVPNRSVFARFVTRLRSDSRFELLPASQDLFDRGLSLYEQRNDKDWSLTDCISFVVMTERKLTDALTGDHHFTQAGFNALFAAE